MATRGPRCVLKSTRPRGEGAWSRAIDARPAITMPLTAPFPRSVARRLGEGGSVAGRHIEAPPDNVVAVQCEGTQRVVVNHDLVDRSVETRASALGLDSPAKPRATCVASDCNVAGVLPEHANADGHVKTSPVEKASERTVVGGGVSVGVPIQDKRDVVRHANRNLRSQKEGAPGGRRVIAPSTHYHPDSVILHGHMDVQAATDPPLLE
mmetsp:Transcript_88515/g.249450  ORF Transcript_88515/g.249450 Transcript_88515/m.249450 type:complete len:209 (+) Transcript_88515:383-1009(+)